MVQKGVATPPPLAPFPIQNKTSKRNRVSRYSVDIRKHIRNWYGLGGAGLDGGGWAAGLDGGGDGGGAGGCEGLGSR